MGEIKRVHFVDRGQDFLFFDVEVKTGKIVDVEPFQYSLWSKFTVLNIDSVEKGKYLHIVKEPAEPIYIIYPISSIEVINQEESK